MCVRSCVGVCVYVAHTVTRGMFIWGGCGAYTVPRSMMIIWGGWMWDVYGTSMMIISGVGGCGAYTVPRSMMIISGVCVWDVYGTSMMIISGGVDVGRIRYQYDDYFGGVGGTYTVPRSMMIISGGGCGTCTVPRSMMIISGGWMWDVYGTQKYDDYFGGVHVGRIRYPEV